MVASMLANLNSTVTFKYSILCYMEGGGGFGGISDATLACGDDAAGRRSCFAHNALILLQQRGGSVVQAIPVTRVSNV